MSREFCHRFHRFHRFFLAAKRHKRDKRNNECRTEKYRISKGGCTPAACVLSDGGFLVDKLGGGGLDN